MEHHQNDIHLEELVRIRKALEDIEFILEYAYIPQTKNKRRIRKDGSVVRECEYIENPLQELRDQIKAMRCKSQDEA